MVDDKARIAALERALGEACMHCGSCGGLGRRTVWKGDEKQGSFVSETCPRCSPWFALIAKPITPAQRRVLRGIFGGKAGGSLSEKGGGDAS